MTPTVQLLAQQYVTKEDLEKRDAKIMGSLDKIERAVRSQGR